MFTDYIMTISRNNLLAITLIALIK